MKDQLIGIETAKLAKEKGFPQNLFNTSWYNEFGIENGRTDLDKDGKPYNGRIIPVELKEGYKRESFSAPTQSLLQKWLREVHNIYVTSLPTYGGKDFVKKCFFEISYNKHLKQMSDKYWYFNTYEEALEVGLQEALKLIQKK